MEVWHQGNHEPYHYNFEHADAFKEELAHFIQSSSNNIAIGTNVAQSFATIINGFLGNWGMRSYC